MGNNNTHNTQVDTNNIRTNIMSWIYTSSIRSNLKVKYTARWSIRINGVWLLQQFSVFTASIIICFKTFIFHYFLSSLAHLTYGNFLVIEQFHRFLPLLFDDNLIIHFIMPLWQYKIIHKQRTDIESDTPQQTADLILLQMTHQTAHPFKYRAQSDHN